MGPYYFTALINLLGPVKNIRSRSAKVYNYRKILKGPRKDEKINVEIPTTFMGDIESNFGNEGRYIHNYLSFWRQFGLIPFLVFFLLLGYKSISICYEWLRDKKFNPVVQFLFYFTIFALLEIVIARSYVFPYIWLSISGIAVFMGSKRQKNESNE